MSVARFQRLVFRKEIGEPASTIASDPHKKPIAEASSPFSDDFAEYARAQHQRSSPSLLSEARIGSTAFVRVGTSDAIALWFSPVQAGQPIGTGRA
jgi:hypothetical protein